MSEFNKEKERLASRDMKGKEMEIATSQYKHMNMRLFAPPLILFPPRHHPHRHRGFLSARANTSKEIEEHVAINAFKEVSANERRKKTALRFVRQARSGNFVGTAHRERLQLLTQLRTIRLNEVRSRDKARPPTGQTIVFAFAYALVA